MKHAEAQGVMMMLDLYMKARQRIAALEDPRCVVAVHVQVGDGNDPERYVGFQFCQPGTDTGIKAYWLGQSHLELEEVTTVLREKHGVDIEDGVPKISPLLQKLMAGTEESAVSPLSSSSRPRAANDAGARPSGLYVPPGSKPRKNRRREADVSIFPAQRHRPEPPGDVEPEPA